MEHAQRKGEAATVRREEAKHAAHMRAAKVVLALLAVLVAGSAAGQGRATQPGAAQPARPDMVRPMPSPQTPSSPEGPSYGPVLHSAQARAEPAVRSEQSPQAQEERAGAGAQPREQEVDPSARPAPQQKDPAGVVAGPNASDKASRKASRQERQQAGQKESRKQPRRRAVQSRVDPVPTEPDVPPAVPLLPLPPPPQPRPVVPGPVQINSCLGGTCIDTNGTTYQTGAGNAAVNSAGRLCTRSGDTMQCF